jgi:hypothetical protein
VRSSRARVALICAALGASPFLSRADAQDGQVNALPTEDRRVIDRLLGPGVVGQAVTSAPIDDTSLYFPLEERSSSYQVTGGPNAGSVQTLPVAKGKRPAGNAAWRLALSPSQAGFLRQTEQGDLVMPAVSDAGEGVIIVTTPPNPFLLLGMKPGETRTLSQTVSVNYLDDPSKQDYSGTLSASYTYLGTYQVTVPAGTYPAVLVRLKYEGKVGPAHTEDSAYYFFAPGIGLVAMISQEDVEAFWIIHLDSRSGKVLAAAQ